MDINLEKLKQPLPSEAVSKHPTKPYLSSIKAIYVTERFNEVFGVGKWTLKIEHVVTQPKTQGSNMGDMVVVKTTFEVPEAKIYLESYGGNDNQDLGDAYKGATTDGITKIGSYLGIGIDVFKGLSNNTSNLAQNAPSKPVYNQAPPQPNYVQKMTNYKKPAEGGKCPMCGAEMVKNPKTGKIFCKEKCWLK